MRHKIKDLLSFTFFFMGNVLSKNLLHKMQPESTERQKNALTAIFTEFTPSPGTYWSMNLNKFAQRAVLYVCVCVCQRVQLWTELLWWQSGRLKAYPQPGQTSPSGTEFSARVGGGKTRKLCSPSWCNVWKTLPSRCKLCHLGHKRLQLWRPCVAFHFSRSRPCNFGWPNGLRSHGGRELWLGMA